MDKKKLTIRVVSLIFFIFILNSLAMKFHWYFSIWWLDMPMHLLGGFWIGLAFFWFLKLENFHLNTILKIILGFLLIAVFWEVFEFSVDQLITQNLSNSLDTFSDICFGLAGMFFAIIYFRKRILLKENFEL